MESRLIPKGKKNTFLKIFYLLRGIPGRIEKNKLKIRNRPTNLHYIAAFYFQKFI